MYNIFYIYTINTQDRQTHSRSHALNTHTSQERINSLISYTRSQEQTASHIYGQKCTSRIMHQAIQLATCIYVAILKNCIMRSVFQFCLCFVTTLKTFCNLL